MCGKIGFASRAEAKHCARGQGDYGKRNLRGKPMRPYLCPRCNQWHLTSMRKVQQRRVHKSHVRGPQR